MQTFAVESMMSWVRTYVSPDVLRVLQLLTAVSAFDTEGSMNTTNKASAIPYLYIVNLPWYARSEDRAAERAIDKKKMAVLNKLA